MADVLDKLGKLAERETFPTIPDHYYKGVAA